MPKTEHSTENKSQYDGFCRKNPEIPLFFHPWWLDTVCGPADWNVILATDKGGTIQGVLPYYFTRRFGLKLIQMPALTPYLGAWLRYPTTQTKNEARYRFQKRVLATLIEQLPDFAYYSQNHPPQLDNHLPFLWRGFRQTTRYSYRLNCDREIEELHRNLKGSVRTELRKAADRIEIVESDDLELFYDLQKKSFQRQGKEFPYSFEFLQRIDNAARSRKQGHLFLARDRPGNYHAGMYLLRDDRTIYNLLQGADPHFGNSGAVKALLWQGVRLAQTHRLIFDFEGSKIPQIESVFSAFGGELTPYYKIYKGGNPIFRHLSALRNG